MRWSPWAPAIQAGVLQGDVTDVLLLGRDTPVTGYRNPGWCVHPPDRPQYNHPDEKRARPSRLAEDNQNAVTIRVSQGEREMAADNKMLGQFDLVGIPPAPRGVPQVEVTFNIDANGIVNVSAKDKGTGKSHEIRIQASGGLSEEEIEQMVKDAEANADSDKARRDLVEARNSAETLINSSEKSLAEHGDKVSAEDKGSHRKRDCRIENFPGKRRCRGYFREVASRGRSFDENGAGHLRSAAVGRRGKCRRRCGASCGR